MSDEFKGSIPNIKISGSVIDQFFEYRCGDTDRHLNMPCSDKSPILDKCFDCIGFNKRFGKYFKENRGCQCEYKVDFGYFILIFLIGKANLLPDDFKIACCYCHDEDVNIDGNWFLQLVLGE